MTNGLSLTLVVLIAGFFLLDHFVLHWGAPLVAARQGLRLIDWLAFWR